VAGQLPADSELEFRRWSLWRRWFGQRSEKYAERYLRLAGYRVLARNVADRRGEIDLLALSPDRQILVVVEVRSITGNDPQLALNTVTEPKQRKVAGAAHRFLSRHRLLGINLRFDVIGLAWPVGMKKPNILHIPDAFSSPDRFQFFS